MLTPRRLVPFLIVAWSFAVHIPGLLSPLLDYHAHRQCQTASMARNYALNGMHFLNPQLDTYGYPPPRAGSEFPLYSYLLAVLFVVAGEHDALGRLLSSAWAAGGALFLWGFARRRMSEEAAVMAALILCVIPVHTYFTRTVQPESLALFGLLGFLYYADRALREPGWTLWPAAAVLGAIACLLKLPFLYLVGSLGVLLALESGRDGWRRSLPGFGFALGAILAATVCWYLYAKSAPGQVLPLDSADHWANLRMAATWKFWKDHLISRLPEIYATYPGLILAGIGVAAFSKQPQGRLLVWWLAVCVLYQALIGQYGWIHKYSALPWAAPIALLAAGGWERLQASPRWRLLAWVLVLAMPLHTALRIKHWYRLERLWLFEAERVLAADSQVSDIVVTNTRETPVLHYYLRRYGYTVELARETPDTLTPKLRQWNSRYFVTAVSELGEDRERWSRYLHGRGRLISSSSDYLLYRLD